MKKTLIAVLMGVMLLPQAAFAQTTDSKTLEIILLLQQQVQLLQKQLTEVIKVQKDNAREIKRRREERAQERADERKAERNKNAIELLQKNLAEAQQNLARLKADATKKCKGDFLDESGKKSKSPLCLKAQAKVDSATKKIEKIQVEINKLGGSATPLVFVPQAA